jgi:phosphatidate cytidylyltransferase
MLIRTISSIVFLIIVIPCILLSDTPLFIAFALFLSVGAIYEMLKCSGIVKNKGLAIAIYILSVLPVLPRVVGVDCFYRIAFPLIFVCALILLTVYTFMKNKPDLAKTVMAWFFSAYAIIGFTSLVLLSELGSGKWYIMFLPFLASWITDTFALLSGMLFGKHKLLPSVSPKKTIEGAIGGSVFCVLFFILYAFLLDRFFNFEIGSYWMIAICGFVCSLVAIVGDLVFSAVKRATGIKDFGNLMPGHGGILDRFDSLVSISIVLLMFVSITKIF